MTTVKRNTVIVLILLVVSAFVYAGTQSRQDDPIVERIVAKCSSIESMRCDFSQVKTVPLMDAPQGSAGRMLYRRPAALKWAYTEPEIIEVLNLEDVKPEDIDNDAPLFGEGLGLDSIDALELIVLMEKNYGIKLQDPAKGKEIFKSINVMADYIQKNRTR